jgi:hypothetical protein
MDDEMANFSQKTARAEPMVEDVFAPRGGAAKGFGGGGVGQRQTRAFPRHEGEFQQWIGCVSTRRVGRSGEIHGARICHSSIREKES